MQKASVVCVRYLRTGLQKLLHLLHKGRVKSSEVCTCERHDDTFILVCTCTPLCVYGNTRWILCMRVCACVCVLIHTYVCVCVSLAGSVHANPNPPGRGNSGTLCNVCARAVGRLK